MEALGGRLERVVVGDAESDDLHARLQIVRGGNAFLVECPIGSAVAFAHRCGAPVFVHEHTLDKRRDRKPGSPDEDLRQRIAGLDTLEFGTYHLE